MPGKDFYADLSASEQIRALAEHHYDPENRHISAYEYKLLLRIAARLASDVRARGEDQKN